MGMKPGGRGVEIADIAGSPESENHRRGCFCLSPLFSGMNDGGEGIAGIAEIVRDRRERKTKGAASLA